MNVSPIPLCATSRLGSMHARCIRPLTISASHVQWNGSVAAAAQVARLINLILIPTSLKQY